MGWYRSCFSPSPISGDLTQLKAQPITVKEKAEYKVKITFK